MNHCNECQCEKCHDLRAKRKEQAEAVKWVSVHKDSKGKSHRFITSLFGRNDVRCYVAGFHHCNIDILKTKDNFFPDIFKSWAHFDQNKILFNRVQRLTKNREKLKEFFGIEKDYPLVTWLDLEEATNGS